MFFFDSGADNDVFIVMTARADKRSRDGVNIADGTNKLFSCLLIMTIFHANVSSILYLSGCYLSL